MFEKEIKFIYDFNSNKTKSLGNFTTFTELTKIGLHPAILKFISADIDYLIFEDRQKLLKNSAFDYSGEKINHYFSLINDEIKKTKKLSADYVNKLILHAVTFQINFLVRPRWALEKFVFEDSPSKSTIEIKQILNYLYFYPYLKKIITSYITKKKLLSINQTDFRDLLTNIDNITIDSSLPSVIESAVNSISEFFSIGSVGKDQLQLGTLKIFLKEKDLSTQLNTLINHFGEEDKTKINKKETLSILLNIDLADDIFVDEEVEEEEEEIAEEVINEDELEEVDDRPEFEVSEKEEFFLENFEEKPINNIEEIDELTDDKLNEDEYLGQYNEEKNLTDDNLLLHDKMHDENPKSLLPEDHFEDDKNHEIKENNAQVFKDDEFEDHEFNSEDPSEIIGDEDYFKDLDHFNLLTEEDENDFNQQEELEKDIEEEVDGNEKIEEQESSFEIESSDENEKVESEELSIEDDDENEVIEETTIAPKVEVESIEEIEKSDESIFELKDSSLLDDIFIPINEEDEEEKDADTIESEQEKATQFEEEVFEGPTIEEDLVEENKVVEEEQENDSFLDHQIDDDELLEEFPEDDEPEEKEITIDEKTKQSIEIKEETSKEPEDIPLLFSEDETIDEIPNQKEEEIEKEAEAESNFYDDSRTEKEQASGKRMIEMSDLLENKNMTKIIEVVFDYDMEDFANTIEKVSECDDKEGALSVLNKMFETNRVNPSNREAETLKEIISKYFDKR